MFMSKKPTYSSPAASQMNQWVRDALKTADLSQRELADRLSAIPGMPTYDRSMVQKMTVGRKVTMDEARAISKISGHPLPAQGAVQELMAKISTLPSTDLEIVNALIDSLLKRQTDAQ